VTAAFAVAAGTGLGAFGADVGPPTPRIASAPARTTAARSASFDIDAAPGLELACALDRFDFAPCTSPTTYLALGLGDHTFRVRARAATGPWSGAASYAWRIVASRALPSGSVKVPRPVLTTMPMRPYVSPRATFAWRAPAARRWRYGTMFACSLDNDRWRRCSTPKSYGELASGPHLFRVRAELRNRRSRVNHFGWTIELFVPEQPTIISQATAATSASFTFGEEDAAGFECRLDGGNWERCASPVAYLGLPAGRHEFCVRALSSIGVAGRARCSDWVQTATASAPAQPPSAPVGADLFRISGNLPTLLRPGSGGVLPLTVSNPNGFDLKVSDLVVSVRPGSSGRGCDGASNLQVVQSNAALGAVSVVVPAHGSVSLPAQGATAPELEMLNLTANQDACKGAVFTLDYSGTGTRAS